MLLPVLELSVIDDGLAVDRGRVGAGALHLSADKLAAVGGSVGKSEGALSVGSAALERTDVARAVGKDAHAWGKKKKGREETERERAERGTAIFRSEHGLLHRQ